MTKLDSKDKKYSEFKETHPVQLDFFELLDLHENKRDKYSGTMGLYDNIPKYFIRNNNKNKQDIKDLIKTRTFAYKKQQMILNVSPALIKQKDGTTKVFYPTVREEIIEDVLRKFATDANRNSFLDDRLTVRFTIYDLRKELKRINHEYSYSEIKESLDVLISTNIEVKTENKELTFKSSMIETLGIVDKNDKTNSSIDEDEKGKKIIYFVRFNSLVSESIKNRTWRILNYEQCMRYKFFISRWLHKRISDLFISGAYVEKPYHISLTRIIRDSGIVEYKTTSENIRQVQKCLDEMIKIGSIDKYEVKRLYDKEKANKISDVIFDIYISDSFSEDLKLNYAVNNDEQQTINKSNKQENTEAIIEGEYKKKEIKDSNDDNFKDEMKELLKKYKLPVKEIDKIIDYKNKSKKTEENIKINVKSAIDYIEKQREQGKRCRIGAIITSSLNEDWENKFIDGYDKKNEEKEDILIKADKYIESIKNKDYKKISKELLKYFGADIYVAWLSNLNFEEIDKKNNTLILSCNNNFIIDTIKKDYLDGIKRKVNNEYVWVKKGIKQIVEEILTGVKDVEIVYRE